MADLIKESIAEAKALRDIAIENAKTSLAETFAPQIKSMISNRLSEGDDLFEEDDMEDMEDMKEGEMEEKEPMDEEKDPAEDEADLMDEGEENPDDLYSEAEDEKMDDLDEIIAELEKEVDDEPMMEEEDMEEPEEEAPVDEGYGEPKDTKSIEEYINELIAEMEGGDEEAEQPEPTNEKVEELEQELKEAYKTISFLKGKMNEALLINSKLLYTGKIFKSFTLDESQKVSILETFDRAKNIRETKLLYASLTTTLREIKSNSNKKVARLKESRASKATLNSTKPAEGKVLEENKTISRLQQLAGII